MFTISYPLDNISLWVVLQINFITSLSFFFCFFLCVCIFSSFYFFTFLYFFRSHPIILLSMHLLFQYYSFPCIKLKLLIWFHNVSLILFGGRTKIGHACFPILFHYQWNKILFNINNPLELFLQSFSHISLSSPSYAINFMCITITISELWVFCNKKIFNVILLYKGEQCNPWTSCFFKIVDRCLR